MYIFISYYIIKFLLLGYREHVGFEFAVMNEVFHHGLLCMLGWFFLVALKYSPWGRDHKPILTVNYYIIFVNIV